MNASFAPESSVSRRSVMDGGPEPASITQPRPFGAEEPSDSVEQAALEMRRDRPETSPVPNVLRSS